MMQMIYSCFVLKGDSMINAGIFDGDSVIVRNPIPTASNGEIVIAMTEEDTATDRILSRKWPCAPRARKATQWILSSYRTVRF